MKYAVRVENEIISRGVQSILFENGFIWHGNTNGKYFPLSFFPLCMGIDSDKKIAWCNESYYTSNGYKIINPEKLKDILNGKPITELQLNNEHTAIIDPNTETVKVGCQTFTFAKVRELAGKLEGK